MILADVDFSKFLTTDLAPEVFSSLCVVGIICIFSVIIAILAKRADPLKKPKGLLFIAETGVNFFDHLVEDMMGKRFRGFGGFIMAIAVYLFIAFVFGLTGLPSPSTYLAVPLSLGLITFVLIHATSVKYTKWAYFKRYIDPIPIMLPINLISMWAPLLSLTLRLFGNALSGWTLMTLIYYTFDYFKLNVAAPFITPVLHAYFDLFSGFIQTTVFLFLSMIFISSEAPEDEIEEIMMKGGN